MDTVMILTGDVYNTVLFVQPIWMMMIQIHKYRLALLRWVLKPLTRKPKGTVAIGCCFKLETQEALFLEAESFGDVSKRITHTYSNDTNHMYI